MENLFLELDDGQLLDALEALDAWKATGILPTRPVLRQIAERYNKDDDYGGYERMEAHLLKAVVARWREEHKH